LDRILTPLIALHPAYTMTYCIILINSNIQELELIAGRCRASDPTQLSISPPTFGNAPRVENHHCKRAISHRTSRRQFAAFASIEDEPACDYCMLSQSDLAGFWRSRWVKRLATGAVIGMEAFW
jgi:hypothetical protein